MTQPRVRFDQQTLESLQKQLFDTSGTMEKAQKDTGSDKDLLWATQNADSARIYCGTLEEWMGQHQRVIDAINRLEAGFGVAIDALVRGELEAQGHAKQG